MAFPELGSSMERQAMEQLLQTFFELPFLWSRRNDAQMDALVQCDAWPMFEALLAEGKGMILITPTWGASKCLGLCSAANTSLPSYSKNPRCGGSRG